MKWGDSCSCSEIVTYRVVTLSVDRMLLNLWYWDWLQRVGFHPLRLCAESTKWGVIEWHKHQHRTTVFVSDVFAIDVLCKKCTPQAT